MTEVNRQPDEYERRYMSDKGEVLFRDRATAPRQFFTIMGATVIASIGAALAVPDMRDIMLPVLAIQVPLMSALALTMMALRTTVTTEVVQIQYGLWGPTIPIDAIESCEAISYSFWRTGGWGIRRSLDGTYVYNMLGDGQRAAEIVYRHGKKKRKVLVSVKQLDAFVAMVNEARARKHAAATGSAPTASTSAAAREAAVREALAGSREDLGLFPEVAQEAAAAVPVEESITSKR